MDSCKSGYRNIGSFYFSGQAEHSHGTILCDYSQKLKRFGKILQKPCSKKKYETPFTELLQILHSNTFDLKIE